MIVLPKIVTQIALLIILIRCGYSAFVLLGQARKNWLDIAFYIAVALLALSWL